MASGLWGGTGSVVSALGTLRDAFRLNGGGFGGLSLAPAATSTGGGRQPALTVNQTFNMGNGDPSTVRDAARLGVLDAARMMGVA
jgi:hypothetical protein